MLVTSRRTFALSTLSTFALSAIGRPVWAASAYPTKPVKIIVAYAPGGANDIAARVFGQMLADRMKQPFLIENRAGGSGVTGTTSVAKSDADGYTLLLGAGGTMTINPGLFPKLSYDPLKDFVPIGLVARSPLVLTVAPTLPVKNVQELIAYAKSRPAGITYASPGQGTPLHLAGELFSRRAGINTVHVPYKGSSPALNDLAAGRVDFMFDVMGSSVEFIRAGRLRALAVSSLQRNGQLPEVPTVDEQGLKGFDVTSWFGLFAPAGTPREIVAALNTELGQAAATKDAREKLAPLGMEPTTSTSDELRALIQTEQARWRDLMKAANIRAE